MDICQTICCKGMAWLLLTMFLPEIICTRVKVPAIIVFGDSTVDAGNNNQIPTLLKSNFEPYGRDFNGGQPTGRFSNGKIAPDFVSEAFGIRPFVPAYLDPMYNITHFATGVCFASAGTGYDATTSDILSTLPLWMELSYYKEYQVRLRSYLGVAKANEVLREALYLISIGTNDFLENYYLSPQRSMEFSVEQYQNHLLGIAQNFVKELYHHGARKISIAGLPPMGCLPLEISINKEDKHGCVEEYNIVAREFNEKLKGMVKAMNIKLLGIQLVVSDVYEILNKIIQKPHAYGIEEAERACCGTGMYEMGFLCNKLSPLTCADANKYVFWDSFHPTERANAIIARHTITNSLARFL